MVSNLKLRRHNLRKHSKIMHRNYLTIKCKIYESHVFNVHLLIFTLQMLYVMLQTCVIDIRRDVIL